MNNNYARIVICVLFCILNSKACKTYMMKKEKKKNNDLKTSYRRLIAIVVTTSGVLGA
jgi:hypothetical protein